MVCRNGRRYLQSQSIGDRRGDVDSMLEILFRSTIPDETSRMPSNLSCHVLRNKRSDDALRCLDWCKDSEVGKTVSVLHDQCKILYKELGMWSIWVVLRTGACLYGSTAPAASSR